MSEALIPSVSIEALLLRRGAMQERLEQAHRLLVEAKDLGGPDNLFFDYHRHRGDFLDLDGVAQALRQYDKRQWEYLMTQSNMWSLLDAQAREEWQKGLDENKFPDLTAENIDATFSKIFAERRTLFERGVIAVFKKLSWDYRTNNPVKFGEKLILSYMVEQYHSWLTFEGGNKLDDLLRLMYVLDGKPVPDNNHSAWNICQAGQWPSCGWLDLLGYVEVKGFKNRNAHLRFLRLDLVDKMNGILAKHYPMALPPARD